MGPKTALKYMREYGSLEKVIEQLEEKAAAQREVAEDEAEEDEEEGSGDEKEKEKAKGKKKKKRGGVAIPEHWPWREAKELFLKPDVTPADQVEVRVCLFCELD